MAGAKVPPVGAGKVVSIIQALVSKPVMNVLVGALSSFVMFGFSYLVRRFPAEAENMAIRIQNIWIDASGAWVVFAKNYMESLTGQKISDEMLKNMVGKDVSLTAKEMSQRIGQAFLAPMFNMILPGTVDWQKIRNDANLPHGRQYDPVKLLNPSDGLLGAERFLGMNLQFQLQAWMLHFIGDTVSMGNMKSLKDLPNAISWSYGIGWLSWLVMGTPFRITIADPLEKLLNMVYRPTQLNVAQAIDAYNAGYIDEETFWRTTRWAGYEDIYIGTLREMGTAKIATGTLKDAYLNHRIEKQGVIDEMRRSGMSQIRANYLISLWELERHDKLLDDWAGEVIKSYEEGFIDETALRAALTAAGWEDIEEGNTIDLQVQISNLKRQKRSQFTKAEVESLYKGNYIDSAFTKEYLTRMGLTAANADILLKQWTAEKKPPKVPEVHKLSKTELRELFDAGKIEAFDARDGLVLLGYTNDQARDIVEVWKTKYSTQVEKLLARIAELEEPAAPTLTKSEVKGLFDAGLMTLSAVYHYFAELGYSDNDSLLLTQLNTGASVDQIKGLAPYTPSAVPATAKKLSKAEIQTMWEYGLLETSDAMDRLALLGYSWDDGQRIMALWVPYEVSPGEPAPEEPVVEPVTVDRWTIESMARAGKMTPIETLNALVRYGYSENEARLLTALFTGRSITTIYTLMVNEESQQVYNSKSYHPMISVYDLKDIFKADILDEPDTMSILMSLGYTATDANLIMRSWT